MAELEEALVLIKQRKEKGAQDLDFLQLVGEEKEKGVLTLMMSQLMNC